MDRPHPTNIPVSKICLSVKKLFANFFEFRFKNAKAASIKIKASAVEPQVFQYIFQPDETAVRLIVNDNKTQQICGMIAVQDLQCPLQDTVESIRVGTFHASILSHAAITVQV